VDGRHRIAATLAAQPGSSSRPRYAEALTFARPQQPSVDDLPFVALIFEIEQEIVTISSQMGKEDHPVEPLGIVWIFSAQASHSSMMARLAGLFTYSAIR